MVMVKLGYDIIIKKKNVLFERKGATHFLNYKNCKLTNSRQNKNYFILIKCICTYIHIYKIFLPKTMDLLNLLIFLIVTGLPIQFIKTLSPFLAGFVDAKYLQTVEIY